MFKTLQMNSRGDEVKQLQVVLNTLLKPSPNLAVDGDFGNGTQAAVMRFQRIHGMNATGIAGWTFWAEVMREKSIDLVQTIATNTLLSPLQGLIILYQRVIAPTALAQLAVSYALKENGVFCEDLYNIVLSLGYTAQVPIAGTDGFFSTYIIDV